MIQLKYKKSGSSERTKPLADGEIETATFTTPADLHDGGGGGRASFANTNNNSTIEISLDTDPEAFHADASDTNSNSIFFVKEYSAAHPEGRYRVLQPSTKYYLRVRSGGASPNGVLLTVTGRGTSVK